MNVGYFIKSSKSIFRVQCSLCSAKDRFPYGRRSANKKDSVASSTVALLPQDIISDGLFHKLIRPEE